MAKRVRAKRPRPKPPIRPGSRSKPRKTKRKIVKRREFEPKEYLLDKFKKKGKKPPVRYRRPVPRGMVKVAMNFKERSKLKTGYLLEFTYGKKQKEGQVGGWKTDPRPVILVFHDDKIKYIEGVNTNYLSEYYVKKVRQIMRRFPGVEGDQLYAIFKRTAKYALTKGYRKYLRSSFKNMYIYVYEDELTATLDYLAKKKQSDLGTANRSKNAETEL